MKGVLKLIFKLLIVFFIVTFAIFMFNLDMKLVAVIYKYLNKYHDNMERDVSF